MTFFFTFKLELPKNRLSDKDELLMKEAKQEIEEQNHKLKIVENIEANIGKGKCWGVKSNNREEQLFC